MSQFNVVDEEKFREVLDGKLGEHIDRAIAVLDNFGPFLSYDVTNVLLHAIDKEKVPEVLDLLEKHWGEHLKFLHSVIRGTVVISLGINETELMFLKICQDTLALTPTTKVA